jgi:hypothetical protein
MAGFGAMFCFLQIKLMGLTNKVVEVDCDICDYVSKGLVGSFGNRGKRSHLKLVVSASHHVRANLFKRLLVWVTGAKEPRFLRRHASGRNGRVCRSELLDGTGENEMQGKLH